MHRMNAQDGIYFMEFWPHRNDWDRILPKGILLPAPDVARTGDRLVVRRHDADGQPPALPAMVARTSAPDANGFRYAARCIRPDLVDFSSCDLRIADAATGMTYRVSSVRMAETVFGWTEVEPVPVAFSDAAMMMRRVVGELARGEVRPN